MLPVFPGNHPYYSPPIRIRYSATGPRARAGRKLSTPMVMITKYQPDDKERAMILQGSFRGEEQSYSWQMIRQCENENENRIPADEHPKSKSDIVKKGVRREAGKRTPVISHR
jgi:hypothetical protein